MNTYVLITDEHSNLLSSSLSYLFIFNPKNILLIKLTIINLLTYLAWRNPITIYFSWHILFILKIKVYFKFTKNHKLF